MGSIAAMNLWQRVTADQARDSLYLYQTAIRRYLHTTAWLHEKEKYAKWLLAEWQYSQSADTYREMLRCWRDTEAAISMRGQMEPDRSIRYDFPSLCVVGDFVAIIAQEDQLRDERLARERIQESPTQHPAAGGSGSWHQRGK